ncbi:hypothetical protein TNCV_4087771 [Trichonephila clavipes]|nr:hypothetical protein TNCV_4087771 [Trichonephila clavipes]
MTRATFLIGETLPYVQVAQVKVESSSDLETTGCLETTGGLESSGSKSFKESLETTDFPWESLQVRRDMFAFRKILLSIRPFLSFRSKNMDCLRQSRLCFRTHVHYNVTYGHWLPTFGTGHESAGPSTKMSVKEIEDFNMSTSLFKTDCVTSEH